MRGGYVRAKIRAAKTAKWNPGEDAANERMAQFIESASLGELVGAMDGIIYAHALLTAAYPRWDDRPPFVQTVIDSLHLALERVVARAKAKTSGGP